MTAATYVLVWREPDSPRLRTYTDPVSSRPLALPLSDVFPPPAFVFHSPDRVSLENWLDSPPHSPPETVAIALSLARDVLGWDPLPLPPLEESA